MTRKTIVALAVGGVAALAITGTAIAAVAADTGQDRRPAVTAARTGDAGTGPAADPVSAERAKEIALGRVGGGTVEEVDRDREHGRPVWEVEIYKGQVEYEVDVDRETGEIVKFEQDDDRDDD
ncbi:PepSY domain-containing protein [Polymorphospora sp. NPDC051019]|uniref:PepSY domain-containing protein n=1 Tax=Polymorphospora sp. NPDC051019 TaxID=3155725 RepID=UPI0034391331